MGAQKVTIAVQGRNSLAEVLLDAVTTAGAELAEPDSATAMLWMGGPADELAEALQAAPRLDWLQLPSAGIEDYLEVLRSRPDLTISCAKNIYGDSVAEYALSLLLALRRGLVKHARKRSWDATSFGAPLVGSGQVVTVLGAGGLAQRFATLIDPFGVHVRVVRRNTDAGFDAPHAHVFSNDYLAAALAGAHVLVITLPLTEHTEGMIGAEQLRLLAPGAIVVNVGRGAVLDTDALLAALRDGQLSAAGLDVTDPEPLPSDHPLWREPGCLITSHTSNPADWRTARLAELVSANISAYAAGEPLRGLVDLSAGY